MAIISSAFSPEKAAPGGRSSRERCPIPIGREVKTTKEIGMLNGQNDSAMNRQCHMDWFMVVDAGFPCPDEVELIDITLAPGKPPVRS